LLFIKKERRLKICFPLFAGCTTRTVEKRSRSLYEQIRLG
jgi:hypothetical protein